MLKMPYRFKLQLRIFCVMIPYIVYCPISCLKGNIDINIINFIMKISIFRSTFNTLNDDNPNFFI